MDSYDTFRFILHLLFILLIVLGSLLVLLVIYVTKQYKSPSGLFIGNLAFIDLLVGAFILPFGIPAIYSEGWPIGRKLCLLNGFTNHCLSSVALLTLAAISFDRYVAIIHAIRYYQIMTLNRVGVIIATLWAFGVVSGIFPLIGWGRYVYKHGISLCVTDFQISKSFTFFTAIVAYGIPLNVIIFIYFQIHKTVRRQLRAIRRNTVQTNQNGDQSLANENEDQPTNRCTLQLTNENEIILTNHGAEERTNENAARPANHSTLQLTHENEVILTNYSAKELTNENAVQETNQSTLQLTNDNAAQSTNQNAEQCDNANTGYSTNDNTNELANENTEQPINQNGQYTEEIITNFTTKWNEIQIMNPTTSSNQTSCQIFSTKEFASVEETISSTNQKTFTKINSANETVFKGTILLTSKNKVYPISVNAPANDHKASPANQQCPVPQTTPNSANQNDPSSRQSVIPTNQIKGRRKATLPQTRSLQRKLKTESKAALTMLAIIGVFVLCVTPFVVYSFYCLHTGESYEIADFITTRLAYSNAIFNPLIYGIMNKLFRKGFYQVFYRIFRCKKRPVGLEGSFSTKSSFTK